VAVEVDKRTGLINHFHKTDNSWQVRLEGP
jgi:hypothetical protein